MFLIKCVKCIKVTYNTYIRQYRNTYNVAKVDYRGAAAPKKVD